MIRWGTFGSVPTIFGILPNVVERQGASSRTIREYLQGASVAGKVPNLENVLAEASRDSAMRGVPLHVYCIHLSQETHPMGSGRPPWAAGELIIFAS